MNQRVVLIEAGYAEELTQKLDALIGCGLSYHDRESELVHEIACLSVTHSEERTYQAFVVVNTRWD